MSLARPVVHISRGPCAMRVPRKKIADLVAFVARRQRQRVAEIDIAVVGSRDMAAMNRRFLCHAGDTDVITFDLSDAGGISGQLIVCADVAVRVGKILRHSPQRELLLYVVHGLLHLMRYDDVDIRAAVKMRARQEELLAEFLKKQVRGQRSEIRGKKKKH